MGDLIYAWIASLASGSQPVVLKIVGRTKIRSPWMMNLVWTFFGSIGGITLGLILGGGFPESWSILLLHSLAGVIFLVSYNFALFGLDITTISPLFSLRTIFAILLGVFFLGESLSSLQWFLVAVIVLVSPFAAYSPALRWQAFMSKHILLTVVAMAALAAKGYYAAVSVDVNGFATTLLWEDFLGFVMLLPTYFLVPLESRKPDRKQVWPLVVIAALSLLYSLAALEAFSRNLALSTVVVSLPLSMVIAVLLGRRYPDLLEKHDTKVYFFRFSAAGIMIISAIWLTIG